MDETLAFDLEANGFVKSVTQIWCIGIANVDTPKDVDLYTCDPLDVHGTLEEGVDRLSRAHRLVAHNGVGYDLPVVNKFYPGALRLEQIWDSMVVGGLLEPWRRELTLASYGRDFKFPKLDFKPGNYEMPDGTPVTWETVDQHAEAWVDMLEYCPVDVTICAMIQQDQLQKLGSRMEAKIDMRRSMRTEHQVQYCLAKQMEHGFRLDVEAAEELDLDLRAMKDEREVTLLAQHPARYQPERADWCYKARTWVRAQEFTPKGNNSRYGYTAGATLTKVTQPMFNPGSDQQCAQRLSLLHGWTPTEYTPGGQPMMGEEVLELLEYPEIEALLHYKRVAKMISQLSGGKTAWLTKVGEDGYVHGYVKSNGARTYRMSHNSPNMAQVSKKDRRMREVWLPDEGHDLVGVDADGLELRLLACYLHVVDNGAYAEAVLNGTKEDETDSHSLNRKAVGLYLRDSAKTFFYAMVYGAANPKLGKIVCEDAAAAGKPRPAGSLGSIGKAARAGIESGIVGLGDLIQAVQARAKSLGYLILPDGRPVKTPMRTALNSLLQGAGAVLMKEALAIFEFEIAVERELHGHFHYLANVHDEVQFSSEPTYSALVGQGFADAIELAGQRLNLAVPMLGSYDIGRNWAETH